MLAIFARLTVGEAITSTEQKNAARRWRRRSLTGLGRVLAAVAASVSACARRAMRASAWSAPRCGGGSAAASAGQWGFPLIAAYMASLMPARISRVLTGQAVTNPATMPICIPNQYTGLSGCR